MIGRQAKPPPPPGAYLGRGKAPKESLAIRWARLGLFALAVIGGLGGLGIVWIHLMTDPLVDARAYYEAAARLNDGLPLYPAGADPDVAEFYRYPPLLAIVLRPLALLPYHVFALLWEAVVLASLVGIVRLLGADRPRTWAAIGLLGVPIGWAVTIAQAHVPMTLLVLLGQPWSIALAANLKLFPILAAVWWIGRSRWQAVGALAGWLVLLGAAQAALELDNSLAFVGTLGLEQVGEVNNISPYAISPLLWAVLAVAGAVAALFLAPTRWGWPAAVALATLTPPRLLVYMLMGLLAALHEPDPPIGEPPAQRPPPDAAEIYVGSAR